MLDAVMQRTLLCLKYWTVVCFPVVCNDDACNVFNCLLAIDFFSYGLSPFYRPDLHYSQSNYESLYLK